MNKVVMSTSATIHYLLHIEKLTIKEIRVILGERLAVAREMLGGKRNFTKQNYLDLIFNFPDLEGRVEFYENVKREG